MQRRRPVALGSDAKSSQVRAQYDALKREHPGRILLFQLGDFYETFEDDARIVARVCDITLTARELSKGDRVALAGVPIHRAAPHIGKLISAGYHVAICDQIGEAGKGLVERQVTRVVTPGTVAEPGLVSPHENNLIVALAAGRTGVGLAAADVTTGELLTTVVENNTQSGALGGRRNHWRARPEPAGDESQQGVTRALLAAELQRLAPAECLIAESSEIGVTLPGHTTTLPPARFELGAAGDTLRRLFGVSSLDGFGLAADSPALAALGALVAYVGENNYRLLGSLREPKPYVVGSHLALDPTTRRNLELTRTARHGQVRGSLFHAVERTRTAMGARRLRRLLGQPLVDRPTLEARLDAVEELVVDSHMRGQLRSTLAKLGDVERLIGRARQTTATPREVTTLAQALQILPDLKQAVAHLDGGAGLLPTLASAIDGRPDLVTAIDRALAEPGGPRLIREGYSAELDELVTGIDASRSWLAQLERRERERTGIKSLKVGFNKVFGYYLEVTRPNLSHVPADYQRRQSLVSAERFVTPELKEREALILTAESRIEELEGELFQALLRKVAEQARPILKTVEAVADLDVLASLADVAADRSWCRPSFTDDDQLRIVGGRHPVLEALLPGGELVPNDCALSGSDGDEGGRLLIVTGPNMGGKSTYLRMVALTVLLAQVGSFVPAESARIGLIDRLFTRVGSEDDLTAGASTFLVEMAETASILRQATARSLVVLDEVGRGTSTHDGLCIAQAVLEHLHDSIGARTLFATHFHELTALEESLSSVRNVTVAVDERDGELAFLYRVVPGAADRSYGVQVARLAGLLSDVTERAAALLREREAGDVFAVDARPVVLSGLDVAEETPPPAPLPTAVERGSRPGSRELASFEVAEVWVNGLQGGEETKDDPGTDSVFGTSLPNVGEASETASSELVDPFAYPEPDDDIRLPLARARDSTSGSGGPGGEGYLPASGGDGQNELEAPMSHRARASDDVASRLLAQVLALDLGNMTPLRALTLLHELQTAARQAVPWDTWMAEIARGRADQRDGVERR
ncbi:MAG: DNA mismatch repair protein MutS [Chloroflexota bacterium]